MSEGRVVAVGPGRPNMQNGQAIPMGVKEGDKVLLPEYGGQVVKLGEQECAPATLPYSVPSSLMGACCRAPVVAWLSRNKPGMS